MPMAYLLLGLAQVAGLFLIPFWSAGIWLQLGSLVLFGWWADFQPIGWIPLVVLLGLAVTAEIAEAPLAAGRIEPAIRRRGTAGALIGGLAGAAAGYAYPLLGLLFSALLGALLGAGAAVFTRIPERSGCLTSVGRSIALAVRATAAIGIALFALYSFRL